MREARRDGVERAVAKFVPIEPGAQRELMIGTSTDLPHVVPVLDSGEHDGMYVLIMPRADYSLRQYITGNVLSLKEKISILADVANGLKEIGQEGLVHRDLKPENVLYTDGVWELCDFAIETPQHLLQRLSLDSPRRTLPLNSGGMNGQRHPPTFMPLERWPTNC